MEHLDWLLLMRHRQRAYLLDLEASRAYVVNSSYVMWADLLPSRYDSFLFLFTDNLLVLNSNALSFHFFRKLPCSLEGK